MLYKNALYIADNKTTTNIKLFNLIKKQKCLCKISFSWFFGKNLTKKKTH